MNKNQINRINEYIDSLENSSLTDDQNSLVLQSKLDIIGGDNSGTCTNRSTSGCSVNSGTCTNYGEACNSETSNSKKCNSEEEASDQSYNVRCHP